MVDLCETYWPDFTFDGNNVEVEKVFCGADQLLFDDYHRVKLYLKCLIRDLHIYEDLTEECKCLLKYVD